MDTELARTFLTVLETGSFIRAAGVLHVTQSTVSARIRLLEDQLGVTLFDRLHGGVKPTPAAGRFRAAAATMVRAWAQARQEAALPRDVTAHLALGAQVTHWDGALVDWVVWLRSAFPHIALTADVASNEVLLRRVEEGLLDAAIVYQPRPCAGFVEDALMSDELVLVATAADAGGPGDPDYLYIDWGADFAAAHARLFEDTLPPVLRFSVGPPALDVLLRRGGSAYFPLRTVEPHLAACRLFAVPGAPRFERPVYLMRPEAPSCAAIGEALGALHRFFGDEAPVAA